MQNALYLLKFYSLQLSFYRYLMFLRFQDLVLKGIVQEYPRKTFKHFIGDPNFVGEDFRAELQ